MKKPYLGVWVDHTQAHLIWLDEQGDAELQYTRVQEGEAAQKSDLTMSGASGVYGGLAPHATAEDKRRQRAKRLYDRLIKAMSPARHVYIFGPGLARKELHKRIEQHKDAAGKVTGVDAAEKMTEAQMVAHVKAVFELPRPPM